MNRIKIKYISWGVALLGLFLTACSDDDKTDPVLPESQLTLTGTDIVFDQQGGTKSFKISTNRGWAVARNEGEWVEVGGELTGEAGEHDVMLKAVINPGTQSRKAKFTVLAGSEKQELEVTQFGSDPEIIAGPQRLEAGCDGAEYTLVIHANVTPLNVTADDWLTVSASPYASASYMYNVVVAKNTGAARTGKIIFTAEGAADTVLVDQEVYTKRYELLKNRLNVSALAEAASCSVKANFDWQIEWPDGQPEWVKGVAPAQGKAGESVEVVFTLETNLTGVSARSTSFRLSAEGEPEIITQAAPVASEHGTRETDSLALVDFAKNLQGSKLNWNFEEPIDKWGPWTDKETRTTYDIQLNTEGRVISIRLMNQTIEGEFPAAISKLNFLRELRMTGLTAKNMKFPADFGNLKELQKLSIACGKAGGEIELADMSGNTALYSIAFHGLNPFFESCETPVFKNMEGIAGVKGLEEFIVNYANIGELPNFSVCSKLTTLRVIASDITRFPAEIANCSKLRTLAIFECRLKGSLPDVFTNTSLTSIDIKNNEMSGDLPLAMFTSPTLMAAYVSDNNFTGNLPKELSTVSKINQFSCRNNQLGGEDVMLPEEILKDERWTGSMTGGGGGESGGWFGSLNICVQQPGYGWDNCK